MLEKDNQMLPVCRASIVIPAYNEEAVLPNCLDSLATAIENLKNPFQVEAIVVDNGSSDDTLHIAESYGQRLPRLLVIKEGERGPGFARSTGARLALSRAALRNRAENEDFWLINTDADTIVSESWLSDWFLLFSTPNALLITGDAKFENASNKQYPNASQLLKVMGRHSRDMEGLFGVINVDGFNSAVERKCYSVVGPYTQPRLLIDGDRYVNLAGEDWDLSTKAKMIGITPLRSQCNPVIASSRRFQVSPREFIDGTAYEVPFEKVVVVSPAPDIEKSDMDEYYQAATLRLCVHFVEKPILVSPSLLKDQQIKERLDISLIKDISRWLEVSQIPNIFYHRNEFIFGYLGQFHKEFGPAVREKLFRQNFPLNEQ